MREDLRSRYSDRLGLLEQLRSNLEQETKEALAALPHMDRVTFRVKGVDSFVAKAADPKNDPPYQDPLTEIEDQVAGRVIVFFLGDLLTVHERLAGSYSTIERSQRRPQRDVEFGYESDHLICVIPPHLKPHGWDMRHDVPSTGYKAARDLPHEIRRELAWIAASAWGRIRPTNAYGRGTMTGQRAIQAHQLLLAAHPPGIKRPTSTQSGANGLR